MKVMFGLLRNLKNVFRIDENTETMMEALLFPYRLMLVRQCQILKHLPKNSVIGHISSILLKSIMN